MLRAFSLAPGRGHDAGHPNLARCRNEDARKHFDRGRFSGPVRPDVAHQFARVERHRHAGDRDFVDVLAREQRLERPSGPRCPLDRAEHLSQLPRLDDGHAVRFDPDLPVHPMKLACVDEEAGR